jgi:tryptophan-rich sensory protein
MSKRQSRSLLVFAGFAAATAGAAWYASQYSKGYRDRWYRELDKPRFAVPEKMIPAVWTALYALIAWSGWRVWCAAPSKHRSAALRLWVSQLVANAKWPEIFFREHKLVRSLADSIALEGSILSYIKVAGRVDPPAARAFIPYAAWIAYTTALNAEIARRNLLRF